MARLRAHSAASRTRRQGELPELEESSSSEVVFWDRGPRAPPTHQPQPDPDANRGLEEQMALSPSLLSNHAGSRAGPVPQPVLVQQEKSRENLEATEFLQDEA